MITIWLKRTVFGDDGDRGWMRQYVCYVSVLQLYQAIGMHMFEFLKYCILCCILHVMKNKLLSDVLLHSLVTVFKSQAAVQVAAGVVDLGLVLQQSCTMGHITSILCVWCCGEGEMRQEWQCTAAALATEAMTHFTEPNTEQPGWRQTLQRAAGI